MCNAGDDCPQGARNRTMARNLFLRVISRSVPPDSSPVRTHAFAELLTRLQLHVPAAGIRKYVELEEIKSSALVRQCRSYSHLAR